MLKSLQYGEYFLQSGDIVPNGLIFDHERGQLSQLDANMANIGQNDIKVDKKPYFSPEGLS